MSRTRDCRIKKQFKSDLKDEIEQRGHEWELNDDDHLVVENHLICDLHATRRQGHRPNLEFNDEFEIPTSSLHEYDAAHTIILQVGSYTNRAPKIDHFYAIPIRFLRRRKRGSTQVRLDLHSRQVGQWRDDMERLLPTNGSTSSAKSHPNPQLQNIAEEFCSE